ncbi:MAG: FlgD immunoglobulin-like domain containing protein [Candidatus Eisenbacteria bacterium]
MTLRSLGRLACVAGLLLLPAMAHAVPSISSISPAKTAANNGELITVFCNDCGYSTDRVYFPGGGFVTPVAQSLNSWVQVRVPATSSGDVYLLKQGAGTASNSVNHDISYNWSGQKWTAFPFTWLLNNGGAPGVTFNDTRDAMVNGYNAWSCASGASMTYGGGTAIATTASDGTNCRYWSNTGWSSGTIAVATWFYIVATNQIVEADIAFNAQHFTWSAGGSATTMSVQNIGTHEEGHTIGLLDLYGAADAAETMYGYGVNGETQKNTLALDDVQGAEYMYSHTRANFTSGTPAGWYWTVVPRNTPDATGSSAPLPAVLAGNTTSYWNAAMSNNGGDCASPGGTNQLWLDDDYAYGLYWGGVWAAGGTYGLWPNLGVYTRGGRHTMRENMDINDETIESIESDNVFQAQYVFEPTTLTNQVPIARAVPPQRGGLTYANCDGLRATGNWWSCVAITPYSAADDYDLRLHNDYTGATSGFGNALAGSAYGGANSDFVLTNGNNAGVGYGATRYVGVTRYSAPVGDPVLIHQSNQVGSSMFPGTGYNAYVSSGTVAMGAYDIVKVHEVYLGSTATSYRFQLMNLTGTADLNISVYAASGDYFGKGSSVASGQVAAPGTNEECNYTPPTAGYYAVVVWKRGNADIGYANDYELRVGASLSNLNTTVTPSGFSSPVVPRNAAGAGLFNAPLTAVLNGNAGTTYLNWATQNEGPNPMPTWGERIYLDTESYVAFSNAPDPNGPGSWQALNVGTLWIRGGRHSLTQYADYDGLLPEPNETDNAWTGQWVWSPLPLAVGAPVARGVPPDAGFGIYPNSDGFALLPTYAQAWVTSAAPIAPGDDYDLYTYSDYASSSSGFSSFLAGSTYSGNRTDFVVGQYASALSPSYYPAVTRFSTAGGGNGFNLDNSNDVGRYSLSSSAQWTGQTMAAGRLADVYEAYLQAGVTYRMLLWRSSGAGDLAFELFPETSAGIYGRGSGQGTAVASGADQDTLEVTPVTSGWCPIVVYRQDGTDSATPVTYTFAWSSNVIVAVDDNLPRTLEFAGIAPNPMRGPGRFHFALPQAESVKLELFDLNGRRVTTVADAPYEAGVHDVAWSGVDSGGRRVDPGLYWARFTAGDKTITRRVSVMK